MIRLPELNFPAVELRRIERDGRTYVPDVVRGGYLVLTPEEWVRRHVIGYLTGYCGVELRTVMTEYPVDLNGTPQRADVVVADGLVVLAHKVFGRRIAEPVAYQEGVSGAFGGSAGLFGAVVQN